MGKNLIDQKKLKLILGRYREILAAYLIGSASQEGSMRKDSDLDIVLLASRRFNLAKFGRLYQEIDRIINHPHLDLRIVIPEKTDPLFLFQLLKGKLLFVRNPKKQIEQEVKFMKLYYDSQHLRNIFHHYLDKRLEERVYGR